MKKSFQPFIICFLQKAIQKEQIKGNCKHTFNKMIVQLTYLLDRCWLDHTGYPCTQFYLLYKVDLIKSYSWTFFSINQLNL